MSSRTPDGTCTDADQTGGLSSIGKTAGLDSQVIEILGRNRLIDELLRAGLEVAVPERDRGIDLIAYADLGSAVQSFKARPIQMKAASLEHFGVFRKYDKFPDLLIAFVWNLSLPEKAATYALSQADAVAVAAEMGWTETASWANGGYSTNKPSKALKLLLEPFRMTPEKWWNAICGVD